MKTLIIYSHPNHSSLNYSLYQETLKGLALNSNTIDVKVIDLYNETFNPVLYFDENTLRRDMHIVPELEDYRSLITWADSIIMVYPIWWGRPPAMLLGFIDRVFASGFAYKNKDGSSIPVGLLKGKKVYCISTMKGPKNYPFFFLGNVHKNLMRKAVLNFVGIKKVKFFEFGSMESKLVTREKSLKKVKDYFSVVH